MGRNSTSNCGLSDAELAALFCSGSESAFSALTDRYIGLIRSITSKYRVAGLDPDDLTQEGLLGLLSAVRSFEDNGGRSFKNYAALCIERRILSQLRRSKSGKSKALNDSVSIDDESYLRLSGGVDPEDMVIGEESLGALTEAFSKLLSKKEQRVLSLYLAGESYGEIAAALGTEQKSVDNAMQRVRRKLREYGTND